MTWSIAGPAREAGSGAGRWKLALERGFPAAGLRARVGSDHAISGVTASSEAVEMTARQIEPTSSM